MAGLPSVVKFTKNGVEFSSRVDRTAYTMRELSRAALRDVGKYVLRECRKRSKERPHASGVVAKIFLYGKYQAFQFWVRKKETDLIVGMKRNSWLAVLQEQGLKNHPKKEILQNAVRENIDQIRLIEGAYLAAIEDENRALGLISEEEYTDDGTE